MLDRHYLDPATLCTFLPCHWPARPGWGGFLNRKSGPNVMMDCVNLSCDALTSIVLEPGPRTELRPRTMATAGSIV